MKNLTKYLINFTIIFYSLFFINLSFTFAADFNLDCTGSGCNKTGIEPLFNNTTDGVWYPGRTLTKSINLKNSSADSKEMDIKPTRTSTSNILEDVMQISIVTNPGGLVIWAGSLSDFYNQTKINMGTFSSGVNQDYNFSATMNSSADNSYQNLESVFDLTLGFWEESPTPTPTDAGGGGGGGGTSDGSVSGASAPVCNDTAPASAPNILFATGGTNSVTLTWSEASAPVSYYLVAYGASPSNNTYGNPNVGGNGTTSYTVSGLSGGTNYCFIVRAGNGCKPGPFSGQVCATPGGIFIPAGPAAGFAEGVLGEATQSAELSSTPSAGILGATQNKTCKDCLWWQILLGEFIVLLAFYFILVKKLHKKVKYTAYFGIFIPILTYIIFLWLNRNCFGGFKFTFIIPSINFFCKYFLILATILYTAVTLYWRHKKTEVVK